MKRLRDWGPGTWKGPQIQSKQINILASRWVYLDVSLNGGFSPQIIHFNRMFHCKSSISVYPYFWKHPYLDVSKMKFKKWDFFVWLFCWVLWGDQKWTPRNFYFATRYSEVGIYHPWTSMESFQNALHFLAICLGKEHFSRIPWTHLLGPWRLSFITFLDRKVMILVLGREVSNLDDGTFTRFPVVSWQKGPTCSTYIRCLSASSRESVLRTNMVFG